MKRMMHIIAAGAALFSVAVLAEGENLITNGSFETYRDTTGAFPSQKHVDMNGSRSVTPWTYAVQGNGLVTIAYSGDSPFLNSENAPDGNVVMAFQRNASLSQTITVPTSGVCKVSFKYRARKRSGNVGGVVYVQIDGKNCGSVTASQTDNFYAADIRASVTEGSHVLTLSHSSSSAQTVIDLVSATFTTNIILNGAFDEGSTGGAEYKQASETTYSNPYWTAAGWTGRLGLAISGSAWINSSLDVGTYALYMQTLEKGGDVYMRQTFTVPAPGIYSFTFHHSIRKASTRPVTRVRIYSGSDTSGTVVSEDSIVVPASTSNAVWQDFSKRVKFEEAGQYTLEFYRAKTSSDIAAIIDDVCIAWNAKIQEGLTFIVR